MIKYTELMKNRIQGKENRVPYQFGHKLTTHEFCQINKIPTPRLIESFETPDDIDFRSLPAKFVLKPSYSSTSRGVMVLEDRGDTYFDSMSQKAMTALEIREVQQAVYDGHPKANRRFTLVEEFIEDVSGIDIPEDYKFLAFQGEIGLIIKIDRTADKLVMSYFDGEFRPVLDDRVVFKSSLADLKVSAAPKNWRRMLDIAKRISTIVPSPCARIDLYDAVGGPVLGEITITPGSFYYPNGHTLSPEENARLGALWKDAEKRLWG